MARNCRIFSLQRRQKKIRPDHYAEMVTRVGKVVPAQTLAHQLVPTALESKRSGQEIHGWTGIPPPSPRIPAHAYSPNLAQNTTAGIPPLSHRPTLPPYSPNLAQNTTGFFPKLKPPPTLTESIFQDI
jgi:hypothetical protein